MKPKGVNRVVVAVKDLEKAIDTYSKLLGATFHDVSAGSEQYGVKAVISLGCRHRAMCTDSRQEQLHRADHQQARRRTDRRDILRGRCGAGPCPGERDGDLSLVFSPL